MSLFGHKDNKPSAPPFPTTSILKMWIDTIQSIYIQELNREADSDGLANYLTQAYNGWDADKIRSSIQESQEWKDKHAPVTKIIQSYPTGINGTLFHDINGVPISVKGFTAFNLLDLYSEGHDVRPILEDFPGYNTVRVFLYTPVSDWKENAWDIPSNEEVLDFLQFMEDNSYMVLLCLVTDGDKTKLPRIKDLIAYLSGRGLKNVILQAVNEPFIHDKLDPSLLKSALEVTDIPYSSGVYTDNTKFYGKVWTDHSARTSDWWRKAHNLYEIHQGKGPNNLNEPKLNIPGIEDEPIRPDECGFDFLGMYMYAASCVLFGAGAVFHCKSMELSEPMTSDELNCCEWFLKGLNVFSPNASLGVYGRIVEPGNEKGGPTESSRTYVMGNYSLRIKQKGINHPEGNKWKALDEFGIAWVRA